MRCYWFGAGGVLMFAMLVTMRVAGAASMSLHVNEPTAVKPIIELGPKSFIFSLQGVENPSAL